MPKEIKEKKEKDWEKEFDERFKEKLFITSNKKDWYKADVYLKDFIRQLLVKEKQKWAEEIERIGFDKNRAIKIARTNWEALKQTLTQKLKK